MSLVIDLKERREAIQRADLEFYRVKREKLSKERAKHDCYSDGELPRDAINRASAAASRAKLLYLARDLENRTDRLECERNLTDERSKRLAEKVRDLQDERNKVCNVLRTLWERKDPTICAILVESNIVNVLRALEDETIEDADSSSQTPIQVSIPHRSTSCTRRSPAVDIRGLPSSSPLNPTTVEMIKLPGSQFLNMQPIRSSLNDSYRTARNPTSNNGLLLLPKQYNREKHELSSTQFKCRKKRTRRSQKQNQGSLAVKCRESGMQLTRQWYDAVRNEVRKGSNASSTYE